MLNPGGSSFFDQAVYIMLDLLKTCKRGEGQYKTACFCVCFRQAGHMELAERLVECQYELTDRLAFYLCGRRPGTFCNSFLATCLHLSIAVNFVPHWFIHL